MFLGSRYVKHCCRGPSKEWAASSEREQDGELNLWVEEGSLAMGCG